MCRLGNLAARLNWAMQSSTRPGPFRSAPAEPLADNVGTRGPSETEGLHWIGHTDDHRHSAAAGHGRASACAGTGPMPSWTRRRPHRGASSRSRFRGERMGLVPPGPRNSADSVLRTIRGSSRTHACAAAPPESPPRARACPSRKKIGQKPRTREPRSRPLDLERKIGESVALRIRPGHKMRPGSPRGTPCGKS